MSNVEELPTLPLTKVHMDETTDMQAILYADRGQGFNDATVHRSITA